MVGWTVGMVGMVGRGQACTVTMCRHWAARCSLDQQPRTNPPTRARARTHARTDGRTQMTKKPKHAPREMRAIAVACGTNGRSGRPSRNAARFPARAGPCSAGEPGSRCLIGLRIRAKTPGLCDVFGGFRTVFREGTSHSTALRCTTSDRRTCSVIERPTHVRGLSADAHDL